MALTDLEAPLQFGDINSRYILATLRHEVDSFTDGDSPRRLASNFLLIPDAVIEDNLHYRLDAAMAFDKAWRGNVLLGTLGLKAKPG